MKQNNFLAIFTQLRPLNINLFVIEPIYARVIRLPCDFNTAIEHSKCLKQSKSNLESKLKTRASLGHHFREVTFWTRALWGREASSFRRPIYPQFHAKHSFAAGWTDGGGGGEGSMCMHASNRDLQHRKHVLWWLCRPPWIRRTD